jgi:hypothetical protein
VQRQPPRTCTKLSTAQSTTITKMTSASAYSPTDAESAIAASRMTSVGVGG